MKARFYPKLEFPKLFTGIGKFKNLTRIKLKNNAKPYTIMVPRRVAIPMKDVLQKKLNEIITQEIIETVDEASEWRAPMVIVPKSKEIYDYALIFQN
ncbi:hypothetical protein AVEN_6400-1 [Araneus ventricosus]|uniref:Reverse transcriptase domain-containing protein n=1 Tax=Araneus ventricosus TaxID=182803 RepID=A0A4Y2RG26_ARAVE|nr:hypothetical protein AVEN_6400-1 [Araneus ventricosus]